ncbi:MAG: inorganic phosphate transporter, partial [Sedimenticola sp.]|nr:inorganic phosphate transporter [Sedimenticola sp.]
EDDAPLTKKERKGLRKVYRHELVKRSALLKIAAAWVITVPVSGLMAALIYYMIRGMMLP